MRPKQLIARWALPLWVLALYIFLYIPITVLVVYSFNNAPFPAQWNGFTLHWYQEFLYSAPLWQALRNSFIISLAATFISSLLGLMLIFFMTHEPAIERWVAIFYGGIVIPEIVLAVSLLAVFSFFSVPLGMLTLIASYVVLALGFVIPIVYGRYKELDVRLIEASLDLGASRLVTFMRVIAPLLMPSVIAAALLVFILTFDDFLLAFFCAGSSTQTLSLYIFSMIRTGVSPIVNALSTVILMVCSILVLLFCALNTRTRIF